jgi:O-antigen ligase
MTALQQVEIQGMALLFCLIYFIIFVSRRFKTRIPCLNCKVPDYDAPAFYLLLDVFVCVIAYFLNCGPHAPALIFLFGATLGQGVSFGAVNSAKFFLFELVSLLTALLVSASFWRIDLGQAFFYHDQVRLSGPWDNPNTFGLLMGTGIMLSIGQTVQILIANGENGAPKIEKRRFKSAEYSATCFYLVASALMVLGLLGSYSRGAWMGTAVGIVMLGSRYRALDSAPRVKVQIGIRENENVETAVREGDILKQERGFRVLQLNWNRFLVFVLLASVLLLVFWHFRETGWYTAHRAFSSVNSVDLSWRNRVAAWEGAFQITAENPWFGVSWNRPDRLYEHYYLPPKLTEGAAIQTNDYLMLGATLGLPALFCFGIYLWLTLSGKAEIEKSGNGKQEERSGADWQRTICHAGAIVLLVGFWFDGGLFKLPTATTFWILLELGAVQPQSRVEEAKSLKAE